VSTSFPAGLDSLTNPSSSDNLSTSVGGATHSAQHANLNDAVEAIEAKVGIDGSAVTSSHDYKLSGVTGADKAVTTARTVSAGTGLTGGGDLSANRTLSIDAGGVGATQLASNAVETAKILNNNVTLAKIVAATAASRLLGRRSGSAGNFEEITLGTGLSMSAAGELSATGGAGGGTITLAEKSADYTITDADDQKLIALTGSTGRTFTLPDSATCGAGWFTYIACFLTGTTVANQTLTLVRAGSDTINGGTNDYLYPGHIYLLLTDGAGVFKTYMVSPGAVIVSATGANTVNLPTCTWSVCYYDLLGAGGSGASGARKASTNSTRNGGGGGGGGSRVRGRLPKAILTAAGSSVTVTIGTGGAQPAAAGSDNSNGVAGNAGGNTTFGALDTAYGGGGGGINSSNGTSGGSGAGTLAAGSVGGGSAVSGGSPSNLTNSPGHFGGGGTSQTAAGQPAGDGGGGGGSSNVTAAGTAGGSSTSGGPGGGGGGGLTSADATLNGGAGGSQAGLNGGGGAGATTDGGAGTAGTSPDFGPGTGGGGGKSATGGGGDGGAGGTGAGGGGGGASQNGAASGRGGAGGNGQALVLFQ